MEAIDPKKLRLMVLEALSEMTTCSECGAVYEAEMGHSCSKRPDELDEFSGAGAIAGYTLPLGMRPPGPRRDIVKTANKSFGGIGKRKSH